MSKINSPYTQYIYIIMIYNYITQLKYIVIVKNIIT